MAFEDLRRAVGFGPAVAIYHQKLPEGFFRKLRLGHWVGIYEAASQKEESCRKLIARSETEILRIADDLSFEQCSQRILNYLNCSDSLYQAILEKKALTANGYWEWQEIREKTSNQELRKTAEEEMLFQRERNFRRCENSYLSPSSNSEERESALRGMLLWASTASQRVSFCLYAHNDGEAQALREISLKKVSETIAPVEEWQRIYDCLSGLKCNPLKEVVLKKTETEKQFLLESDLSKKIAIPVAENN